MFVNRLFLVVVVPPSTWLMLLFSMIFPMKVTETMDCTRQLHRTVIAAIMTTPLSCRKYEVLHWIDGYEIDCETIFDHAPRTMSISCDFMEKGIEKRRTTWNKISVWKGPCKQTSDNPVCEHMNVSTIYQELWRLTKVWLVSCWFNLCVSLTRERNSHNQKGLGPRRWRRKRKCDRSRWQNSVAASMQRRRSEKALSFSRITLFSYSFSVIVVLERPKRWNVEVSRRLEVECLSKERSWKKSAHKFAKSIHGWFGTHDWTTFSSNSRAGDTFLIVSRPPDFHRLP
jgi:hypothetical protein